jgi:hypothetical protein
MLTGSAHPRRWTSERARDYYGGVGLIALGLGAAMTSLRYGIGSVTDMGAGFFPAAVGCLLALLGLGIALGAWRAQEPTQEPTQELTQEPVDAEPLAPEWRGWLCIILSIIAFIVIGAHLGLLPATFAIVFISALGDRRNTIRGAALLAAAISLLCVVLFWWALRVQMPLLLWNWS